MSESRESSEKVNDEDSLENKAEKGYKVPRSKLRERGSRSSLSKSPVGQPYDKPRIDRISSSPGKRRNHRSPTRSISPRHSGKNRRHRSRTRSISPRHSTKKRRHRSRTRSISPRHSHKKKRHRSRSRSILPKDSDKKSRHRSRIRSGSSRKYSDEGTNYLPSKNSHTEQRPSLGEHIRKEKILNNPRKINEFDEHRSPSPSLRMTSRKESPSPHLRTTSRKGRSPLHTTPEKLECPSPLQTDQERCNSVPSDTPKNDSRSQSPKISRIDEVTVSKNFLRQKNKEFSKVSSDGDLRHYERSMSRSPHSDSLRSIASKSRGHRSRSRTKRTSPTMRIHSEHAERRSSSDSQSGKPPSPCRRKSFVAGNTKSLKKKIKQRPRPLMDQTPLKSSLDDDPIQSTSSSKPSKQTSRSPPSHHSTHENKRCQSPYSRSRSSQPRHTRSRSPSLPRGHSKSRSPPSRRRHSRSRSPPSRRRHSRSRSPPSRRRHSRSRSPLSRRRHSRSRSPLSLRRHSRSRSSPSRRGHSRSPSSRRRHSRSRSPPSGRYHSISRSPLSRKPHSRSRSHLSRQRSHSQSSEEDVRNSQAKVSKFFDNFFHNLKGELSKRSRDAVEKAVNEGRRRDSLKNKDKMNEKLGCLKSRDRRAVLVVSTEMINKAFGGNDGTARPHARIFDELGETLQNQLPWEFKHVEAVTLPDGLGKVVTSGGKGKGGRLHNLALVKSLKSMYYERYRRVKSLNNDKNKQTHGRKKATPYGLVPEKWQAMCESKEESEKELNNLSHNDDEAVKRKSLNDNRKYIQTRIRDLKVGNIQHFFESPDMKVFGSNVKYLDEHFSWVCESDHLFNLGSANIDRDIKVLSSYVQNKQDTKDDKQSQFDENFVKIKKICDEKGNNTRLLVFLVREFAALLKEDPDLVFKDNNSKNPPSSFPFVAESTVFHGKYSVCQDSDTIYDNLNGIKALAVTIELFFVFNYMYPKKAERTFDFIQRILCRFGLDTGGKTALKKPSKIVDEYKLFVYKLL